MSKLAGGMQTALWRASWEVNAYTARAARSKRPQVAIKLWHLTMFCTASPSDHYLWNSTSKFTTKSMGAFRNKSFKSKQNHWKFFILMSSTFWTKCVLRRLVLLKGEWDGGVHIKFLYCSFFPPLCLPFVCACMCVVCMLCVCVHMHEYMCSVCVCVCVCVCMCVHMHAYMCSVCVCVYIYMCALHICTFCVLAFWVITVNRLHYTYIQVIFHW